MPPGNFVNVPRVAKPPEFKGWLETLLQTPQNRKVFVSTGKNVVDKCFLVQVQHQCQYDFHKVLNARRGLESSSNKKFYSDLKSKFKAMTLPHDEAVSEAIAKLTIPQVGAYHRSTEDYDGCEEQTYEMFAGQLRRSNKGVGLTKEIMDAAFRDAALRLEISGASKSGKVRSMVDRCLNIESKRYWKKVKK